MSKVPKSASKSPNLAERELALKYTLYVKIGDIGKSLVRWTGIGVVAWIAKETIVPFAGGDTHAYISVLVNFVTDLGLDDWVKYISIPLLATWGTVERKLRKSYIRKFSRRISALEQFIDGGRTSSGLTVEGNTRPED